MDRGTGIIRIITGIFLVYHGTELFRQEIIDMYLGWDVFRNDYGRFVVYAGKTGELVAGILLLSGLWTRIGSILAAITMTGITFYVGHGKVWYEDQHPFLFVLLAMMFFFTGPGAWSIDGQRTRKSFKAT